MTKLRTIQVSNETFEMLLQKKKMYEANIKKSVSWSEFLQRLMECYDKVQNASAQILTPP